MRNIILTQNTEKRVQKKQLSIIQKYEQDNQTTVVSADIRLERDRAWH